MTPTVYVLRAGDTNLFKIGFTTGTTADRMRALQTGCPYPLSIYDVIQSEAAQELERLLHRELAPARTSGEWFNVEPERLGAVLARYKPEGAPYGETVWVECRGLDTGAFTAYHVPTRTYYFSLKPAPFALSMCAMHDGAAVIYEGELMAPEAWFLEELPADIREPFAAMATRVRAKMSEEVRRVHTAQVARP
jgi:hypothetical protein